MRNIGIPISEYHWSKPFAQRGLRVRGILLCHYKDILKVPRPPKIKPAGNDRKQVNKRIILKRKDFFDSFVSAKVTFWRFATIFDFMIKSKFSLLQKFCYIKNT